MYHPVAPAIGQWYQDKEGHELFKVVAKSVSDDAIQIQYFSGDIAELDFDTWFELSVHSMPAPEDSSGPFELSKEELGYESENRISGGWTDPLAYLEPYKNDEPYDQYNKYDQYFDNFQVYHRFEKNNS